jgi:hypothetical protein
MRPKKKEDVKGFLEEEKILITLESPSIIKYFGTFEYGSYIL